VVPEGATKFKPLADDLKLPPVSAVPSPVNFVMENVPVIR
jgi:hypothetical protein